MPLAGYCRCCKETWHLTLISLLAAYTNSIIFNQCNQGLTLKTLTPGPHSDILMTEGVRSIFLGLKFWPKGMFWGFMKDAGIFLGH